MINIKNKPIIQSAEDERGTFASCVAVSIQILNMPDIMEAECFQPNLSHVEELKCHLYLS